MKFSSESGSIEYGKADIHDLDPFRRIGIMDAIIIHGIDTIDRGKGLGSQLLGSFLKLNSKKNIILHVDPYEQDDFKSWVTYQERLINWYSKFGFIHIGDGFMYKLKQ